MLNNVRLRVVSARELEEIPMERILLNINYPRLRKDDRAIRRIDDTLTQKGKRSCLSAAACYNAAWNQRFRTPYASVLIAVGRHMNNRKEMIS